jgi:hypothetical protein
MHTVASRPESERGRERASRERPTTKRRAEGVGEGWRAHGARVCGEGEERGEVWGERWEVGGGTLAAAAADR